MWVLSQTFLEGKPEDAASVMGAFSTLEKLRTWLEAWLRDDDEEQHEDPEYDRAIDEIVAAMRESFASTVVPPKPGCPLAWFDQDQLFLWEAFLVELDAEYPKGD